MLRLRLKRVGKKKQPSYRLVAIDSRCPRDGRVVEELGYYNPRTSPRTIVFNDERVLTLLKTGASPSDIVKKLFIETGLWESFTGKKETLVYRSTKAPKKKTQERMKQEQEKQEKLAKEQAEKETVKEEVAEIKAEETTETETQNETTTTA
ncbi:MAG: 30S ribosomal protein S16 [Armatimonadota bacterium]